MTKKTEETRREALNTMFRSRGSDPEPCDPNPVEMPLGYCRPTPLQDMIANMVRQAIEIEKDDNYESIEEADDFEEESDELLDLSPYTFDDVVEELQSPAQLEPDPTPTPPPTPPTGDSPDPNETEPEQPS